MALARRDSLPTRSLTMSPLWSQPERFPHSPVAARGVSLRGGASRRGSKSTAQDQASDRGRIRPSRSPVRRQAQIPRKRERRS